MKAMVKMSKVMTKRCYITILNLYLCLYSRTSFPPEIHKYTPLAKTVWDFLSESIYFTQKGDVLASYELQKQVHKHFNQPPIHHMSFFFATPSLLCLLLKKNLGVTTAGSPFVVWHPDPLAIRQSRANASIGARLDHWNLWVFYNGFSGFWW